MQLSPQAVYNLARDGGFSPDQACNAIGTCKAESGFDPYAVGINKGPNASVDRGICQWNSLYHPEVTNEQAFTPRLAFIEMFRVSRGTDFSPWYGWTTGAGQAYAIAFRKMVDVFETTYQIGKTGLPDAGEFAMTMCSAAEFRRRGWNLSDLVEEDKERVRWLNQQIA